MSEKPIRVLFVCMGNICRSPTAEGVFTHLVKARNLAHRIEIDSAGTGAWHAGEAPDQRAQAMAKRRGIDISQQRARAVNAKDFNYFDYICAMDLDNLRHLTHACPMDLRDRLHLFCDFATEYKGQDVPDPYYGGKKGFERVFTMVERAAEALLDEIVKRHL